MIHAPQERLFPERIYLASWPRSGNTLLRAILWQCYGLKTASLHGELILDEPACRRLVGVDTKANIIKTHSLPNKLTEDGRTIYIIRDGRAACVSYWHYYHDILKEPRATLEDVVRGRTMFGSWSKHVGAWTDKADLVLRFEEMLPEVGSIGHRIIGRLNRFLGCNARCAEIAGWSQFHQAHPTFFRVGNVDGWHDELKDKDLELFYELHGDVMTQLGYTDATTESA